MVSLLQSSEASVNDGSSSGAVERVRKEKAVWRTFFFLSSPFGELSFSPLLNLNLGGETAEFARRFSCIGLKMHAH